MSGWEGRRHFTMYPFSRDEMQGYEELVVQPQERQKSQSIPLIPVSRLDDWAQPVFEGVSFFNRLQSWVFEIAYNSDNNMLVCAPTGLPSWCFLSFLGAGKTNVALLAIVHEVKRLLDSTGKLPREELKVIYVAPMKALAQEIVAKFSSRLNRLGLTVRELTGRIVERWKP